MDTSKRLILVMATLSLLPVRGTGQNTAIPWSSITMGFAVSSSPSIVATSVVGQQFAGVTQGPNTIVTAGFQVDTLFRTIVSVPLEPEGLTNEYALLQNYPNPFNPKTGIRFQVPGTSRVRLVVYDLLGREIATLVDEAKPTGVHEVEFDARALASGVYLYRLQAGQFVDTKRLLLIR